MSKFKTEICCKKFLLTSLQANNNRKQFDPTSRCEDIERTEADSHLVARPEESRSFNGSWPKNDRSFTFVDFTMGYTDYLQLCESLDGFVPGEAMIIGTSEFLGTTETVEAEAVEERSPIQVRH